MLPVDVLDRRTRLNGRSELFRELRCLTVRALRVDKGVESVRG